MIDNITVLESNQVYRVGNILLHDGARWKRDLIEIAESNMDNPHNNQWSNTLLHYYLNKIPSKLDNFTKPNRKIFRKSVKWFLANTANVSSPTENEMVLHIRAGDVLEKT